MNPTGLNIPRVDALYREQQVASNSVRADLIDELQQLVYDEASICILVEYEDIELYRADRWEFTHTDWLSGILSLWNWESWLEAAPYTAPPAAPISFELIAIASIGIIAVIVVIILWRSKKG